MNQKIALIIDDEPDITTYHGTLLSDHGWKVLTANTAEDGLMLAKGTKPDVIMLDVMMPDRGGLSTLVAFRKDENLKEVPIILVTGIQECVTQDFENFLSRFKHYSPDAYLEKPVDRDLLFKTLDDLTA